MQNQPHPTTPAAEAAGFSFEPAADYDSCRQQVLTLRDALLEIHADALDAIRATPSRDYRFRRATYFAEGYSESQLRLAATYSEPLPEPYASAVASALARCGSEALNGL